MRLTKIILACAMLLPSYAEAKNKGGQTEHFEQQRCGIHYFSKYPALTHAWGKVTGKTRHYISHSGRIDEVTVKAGDCGDDSEGEKRECKLFTLVKNIYTARSQKADKYMCSELKLKDIDGDGDLDIVYASPVESVVLENQKGNFSVATHTDLDFKRTAKMKIQFIEGKHLQVIVSDAKRDL